MSASTIAGRKTVKNIPLSILYHLVLIAFAVGMLYPLLWMLSSSFKPGDVIFKDPGLWSSKFTLENYIYGWNGLGFPFSLFFRNSFIVTIGAVIGNVVTCSITAFAFARLRFKYKSILFAMMLITMMLPGHVTLIPRYVMFFSLGWIDSYLPLVIPRFFAVDSFFIFLMVQFIRGLPRELDEAATVDGANAFQVFFRVILPLSVPALVTTAIFTFIWTWDDFFSHILYINNITKYTVSLALRGFLDSTGESSFGPMFAMSILSLIPVFAFFISAQELLVEGIATTGLKG